ncbi:MAG: PEP-CTERM sorting domain-containing protein [Sphingomonadaceae bacterium]
MNKLYKTALGLGFAAMSAFAQADTTVAALTGSSQLDLQGNFAYALTLNGNAAGTTIGDATFTNASTTSGVSLTNQNYIGNWSTRTFTNSQDDIKLGNVMTSIVWSYVNPNMQDAQVVMLSMSGLTVGATYKTQLLFDETIYDRGFNVYRDNTSIATDVSPFGLNTNSTLRSAVLTDTFIATSTTVTYGLGGIDALHSDNNPILNAATLEVSAVPEPETYAMLLAGLGMLGWTARRRKQS